MSRRSDKKIKEAFGSTNGRTLLGMTSIHPIGKIYRKLKLLSVNLIGTYRLQLRIVKGYHNLLPESYCWNLISQCPKTVPRQS